MPTKVLIVDDSKTIRKLVRRILRRKGYEVIEAENGHNGIIQAKKYNPQAIVLDVVMPDINGFEVCASLKNNEQTKDIPVIMLTANSHAVDKIKGLEIGAADYITKPFDEGEFIARVALHVRMKNLWDELQQKNRILEELTKKDSLTHLYNHAYFVEKLQEEYNRAQRYQLKLCCAIIDIDYFKNVNDSYGHQAGDIVLKALANIFLNNLRNVDFIARYGGEEFALIFPHTEITDAASICERIRNEVQITSFHFEQIAIEITISVGIAGLPDKQIDNFSKLIRYADQALYTAKRNGRNQIVQANQ